MKVYVAVDGALLFVLLAFALIVAHANYPVFTLYKLAVAACLELQT